MPVAKFVKDNLVLVVGLTLPVLLMLGFLAASAACPSRCPIRRSTTCVFSVQDYQARAERPGRRAAGREGRRAEGAVHEAAVAGAGLRQRRVAEALPLRGGVAHGARSSSSASRRTWRRSRARARTPVAATAGLRLDTTLQSPDGYELVVRRRPRRRPARRDLRQLAALRAAAAQGRAQRADRHRRRSRRSPTARPSSSAG